MEQFTFLVPLGFLVPFIMSSQHYLFANFVFDFILVIATTSSNLQFLIKERHSGSLLENWSIRKETSL